MWDQFQQWQNGLRQRMGEGSGFAAQGGPQMMPPNFMDSYKRFQGYFRGGGVEPASQKYVRPYTPAAYGANAPTPNGDLRPTMNQPYSPERFGNAGIMQGMFY